MKRSLHIFLTIFVTIFGAEGAEDELDAVVAIYRHGDRTPVKPYPTDPYRNASFWPVDFGQLTNRGKLEQLELGKWLRNRYQNFLPILYSEKDIYVRSTDVDRTLMSAEANLAGLYPPVSKQIWDKEIKWQPIPIHTVPETEDAILSAKKPCPKYNLLQQQLFKSDYFRNITHRNHDLYAYLTRYSGTTISTLETLEFLYNTFLIETLYNYTLPDWVLKVYPNKLEPWAFLSFATQTYTTELARLKTGPFFSEIITYFKDVGSKKADVPKFRVYSAHDTTIANVLNAMGVFEYHSPPYASTILFELRKRSNGRNYVNIFYKNTTEARQLNLKPCDVNCDLADFIAVLKPITVSLSEWEEECKLKWSYSWPLNLQGNIILLSILMGIILMTTGIIVGLKRVKKENEANYVQLPNEEYA
ncbi:testicular acid phosphatase homolog isoform X1 [Anoplophora glabripennis]|uniref:testicular acid phosphatase homolog isoform X1 n=1 Tax=Anoplophora glabripennis TaxID=217634 RepID=UPI000874A4B1|nr:testicular acid phosphatase homolog isoform X1 [Anoplophora glabripennis]